MGGKAARSLGYPWGPNHLILTPERVGHWNGVYEHMGFRYTETEGSLLLFTVQMVSLLFCQSGWGPGREALVLLNLQVILGNSPSIT